MDYIFFALGLLVILLFINTSDAQTRGETRRQVERLEANVDQLLRHQGLEPVGPDLSEVHRLLAQGEKINAVRAYRKATGADLKTAADAVKELQRRGPGGE